MNQGTLLSIVIPTATVLVGILVNNRQIDGLRNEFNAKFDGLRNEMNARFEAQLHALLRVEQVLDARLQRLEERYR